MDKAILRRDLEDILNSIDSNNTDRARICIHIDQLEKELVTLEKHRDRLESQKINTMEKLNREEQSNG